MDSIRNPYTPGAGFAPPELTGRREILRKARISLERIKISQSSKNIIIVGLRGVGKTVLLKLIQKKAEENDIYTLNIEASKNRPLPTMLVPQLRLILLKLSNREAAKDLAQRALKGLAGFVKAFKVKYQDIQVSLDFDPEPGLADNGNLEIDLQDLLQIVGEAAKADKSCVAILVDELQYVDEHELSALIMALHQTAQRQLPVMMIGAGLPQVRGYMGNARSYVERLFDFPEIGALSLEDAMRAIAKPAKDKGVEIEPSALDIIISQTQCYPYFLQEWGEHVWNVAERSPVTAADVEAATRQVIAYLDENFFPVRFDRLTPSERIYLRAMADFGAGPHRSKDIAQALKRNVNSLSPVRAKLVNSGMIWSPSHGEIAFTIPMFDEFMLRIMSDDEWRQER